MIKVFFLFKLFCGPQVRAEINFLDELDIVPKPVLLMFKSVTVVSFTFSVIFSGA